MARRDPIKQAMEALALHARAPHAPSAVEAFRNALEGRTALVAGRAAKLAAEHGLTELLPSLAASFDFFMQDAARRDKSCVAKLSIAEALDRLEHDDPRPFLSGVRHVQLDPSYGRPVDAAAALRGRCAAALVRLGHPDALRDLTRLLLDPWPEARIGAVRATAYAGGREAELLLRVKIHAGDEQPPILGECFAGLMAIAPETSIGFVADFLRAHDPAVVEQAALALGESRHPRAFAALKGIWDENVDETVRKSLLLATSLLRSDEAFDHLLAVCADASRTLAAEAVHALTVFRSRPERAAKIRSVLEDRGEPSLLALFDDSYPPSR
jgi:hypothetical protein